MSDPISNNRDVYNKIAPFFAKTREFVWNDLKPLAKYTKKGDKILDLGCGAGRLYQMFEDMSIDYTGVDQSEGQIEIAKKVYPNGIFLVAEMQKLPFESGIFDVIYCIAAFHHLPNEESRNKTLQEILRILKIGGFLVMTNWNLESEWAKENIKNNKWQIGASEEEVIVPWKNKDQEILGNRYYYNLKVDYLEKILKENGFEIVDKYYTKKGEVSDLKNGENSVIVVMRK